jgi:hypothetical protein
MARPVRLKALDIALDLARDHVHEVGGNNRGRDVERIIHYAQGQVPESWCVDFVIYCWGHAGSNVIRPGFPRAVNAMDTPRTHSVPLSKLKPGMPVRLKIEHVELFIGWRRRVGRRYVRCPRRLATHMETVGGNTGADGARSDGNGQDGVYVRYRPLVIMRDGIATS